MTACVNNEKEIKGGVSGKVLRTVAAGVLAMSMMPAAALATTGAADAEATPMSAEPGTNNFADGNFGWNVDKNSEGKYVVEAGDAFYLTSITDVFGAPSSVSDVTVVYAAKQTPTNSDEVKVAPYNTKGTYYAIVIDKAIDLDNLADSNGEIAWESLPIEGSETFTQAYSVVSKPLADSYFYEGLDTTDRNFKYTGTEKDLKLADADGNALELGTDYKIVSGMNKVIESADDFAVADFTAGTHTVVVEGLGNYDGSLATLKYTIDPIDFANDTFSIDIKEDAVLIANTNLNDTSAIYVNGEQLANGVVDAGLVAALQIDGNGELQAVDEDDLANVTGERPGLYTFDLTPKATAANFVNTNATASVEMTVVDEVADVLYGTEDMTSWNNKTFVTSEGQAFNPDAITAWNGGSDNFDNKVNRTVTVTKDGEPVTDYSEPGTYTVTVEVATPSNFAYGAKVTKKFNVVANQFSAQPKVYWQMADGTQQAQEYTGGEIVPEIVVKAGSETLAAGTDYQVTYEDKAGNAVESPVEPGDYTAVVDFEGSYYVEGLTDTPQACGKVEVAFTINKATIESAEADKDVYAYTGEAVKPVFTAYTNDDLTGLSVEIDPDKTPVTYFGTEWRNAGADGVKGTEDDVWTTDFTKPIKASALKDEGFYVAKVSAPVDDPHFQGVGIVSERFEISEYAKYEDVDANAWYANSVYAAKDLDYMSGVSDTKLFMPEAPIAREQVANVLFRMAGASDSYGSGILYFPTNFSDVDSWAWYAKPVAWANEAGVMGGYGNSDVFGVGDYTTREQVAAIFYNYAKSQGKDVTVADEAAALAKVNDADTISDWAKTAVAWAVENGIMGNGGSVMAQNTITRAEMAAMAVNFQPEALK